MAYYSAIVRDENEAPIPGALVAVVDYAGKTAALTDNFGSPVVNPVVSDALGEISFNAVNGRYKLSYYFAGRKYFVDAGVVVGNVLAAIDPSPTNAGEYVALDADGNVTFAYGTGADAGLRTDLAASNGSALVGFIQAGTATVLRTMQDKAGETFSAQDLGALCNGVADDGAILTAAIAARFGTIAGTQSKSPVTINFGDSRYVYNLVTPIIVQQDNVQLVGSGAILQCSGDNAIVCDFAASGNILFGVVVDGFALSGTVTNDAIVVRSGSQCNIRNITNYAVVGQAIVWFNGTISSHTSNVRSDATAGSCVNVIRETVLEKTPGNFFNCIANTHDVLGYFCSGAGVALNESDACQVSGDLEACGGPAVDLLNSRFCTVSIYAEVNGSAATGTGTDTADDVRIRSVGGGSIISRSINNTIESGSYGGQMVGPFTPNNVHVMAGDNTLIVGNSFGGNVRIEAGCASTKVGIQARWIGTLTDLGSGTISQIEPGKTTYNIGTSTRLSLDAFAAGGAKVGSPDALLRLYGVTSLSMGSTVGGYLAGSVDIADAATTGTVTFPVAEPDANFLPFVSMWDTSGASATRSVRVTSRTASAVGLALDVAPGAGQSVRVSLLIVRTV